MESLMLRVGAITVMIVFVCVILILGSYTYYIVSTVWFDGQCYWTPQEPILIYPTGPET